MVEKKIERCNECADGTLCFWEVGCICDRDPYLEEYGPNKK